MQLLNKHAKQKAANRPAVILDSLVFVYFQIHFKLLSDVKAYFGMEGRS